MKRDKKYSPPLPPWWFVIAATAVIVWVYRAWLLSGIPLTAGDWGAVYPEAMRLFSVIPQSWNMQFGNGLGGNDEFLLGLNTYYYVPVAVLYRIAQVPWIWIERIFWYIPFILLSASGAYALARELVSSEFSLIGAVIYTVNTYALMIAGGGQMGVAMGYAAAPWVYWSAIRMFDRLKGKTYIIWSLIAGLVFSAEFLFDLRLAYILSIGLVLYAIPYCIRSLREGWTWRIIAAGAVVVGVVTGLHAYWLIPFAMQRANPLVGLGDQFVNPGMVKFLSFAPFEHTLSFLHPNWPENVFGKIHFLRPEFLLIPLAAFGSLIYIQKSEKRTRKLIVFFSFLALLGAFLSKGANDPAGNTYLWFFTHVPGFIMLRDPTKFYLLTALSFSVLIPVTIEKLLVPIRHRGFAFAAFVSVLALWAVIHHEAFTGALKGTFMPQPAPREYGYLAEYLSSQKAFSRVLWVPMRQRYGYDSDTLPALSFSSVGIDSVASFARWIDTPAAREELARMDASYIVVPTDPGKELFLTNGKYDDAKRRKVLAVLEKSPDMTRVPGFGEIGVFRLKKPYGHVFFADKPSEAIRMKSLSPARYIVTLPAVRRGTELVFSETYNAGWRMVIGGRMISPVKTADALQAYSLPGNSGGTAELSYAPQRVVMPVYVVSVTLFVVLASYLLKFVFVSRKRSDS